MAKEREVLDRRWRQSIADIVRTGARPASSPTGVDADDLALQIGAMIDGLAIQVLMDHVTDPEECSSCAGGRGELIGFSPSPPARSRPPALPVSGTVPAMAPSPDPRRRHRRRRRARAAVRRRLSGGGADRATCVMGNVTVDRRRGTRWSCSRSRGSARWRSRQGADQPLVRDPAFPGRARRRRTRRCRPATAAPPSRATAAERSSTRCAPARRGAARRHRTAHERGARSVEEPALPSCSGASR